MVDLALQDVPFVLQVQDTVAHHSPAAVFPTSILGVFFLMNSAGPQLHSNNKEVIKEIQIVKSY